MTLENAPHAALTAFFERYAKASLGNDPQVLAAMYAPSFIVGGPRGSATFANDARFLDWLKEVHDFNRKHGMRTLEIVSVAPTQLSPVHTLVIVKWGARFEKTGDRLVAFQIAYLLENAADGALILSYISEADQEAEMKALGIL